MIFAPLLFLSIQPMLPEVSALVEPGHAHDWVQILSDDEGTMWHDRNWTGEYVSEGKVYPLVLTRLRFFVDPKSDEGLADVKIAADCENDRLGIYESYAIGGGLPMAVQEKFDVVEFDFAEAPLHADDIPIFKVACGADWKPKAAKE